MTSQYRHRRTSVSSASFPNPIEPGEIAVNTANRQIVVGDAAAGSTGVPKPLLAIRYFDTTAQYVANDYVQNGNSLYRANKATGPGGFIAADWNMMVGVIDPQYVAKAGDTMAGALQLPAAAPVAATEATNKAYVDTLVANKSSVIVAIAPPAGVPDSTLWFDQISGQTYIKLNDGNTTQWVAQTSVVDNTVQMKAYADAKIIASDTPPATPVDNSIWYETDTGNSFYRLNDGTSTQWVSMMGAAAATDSPTFTGDPKAPTPLTGDNDSSIATTAFVQNTLAAFPLSSGAWTSYPVTFLVTSGSGTGTGRYMRIGKTVLFTFALSCTATGSFNTFTLPFAAAAIAGYTLGFAFAREVAATGRGWHGQINATSVSMTLTESANNAIALTTGWQIQGAGFYEVA
jgi:hypothetical protein